MRARFLLSFILAATGLGACDRSAQPPQAKKEGQAQDAKKPPAPKTKAEIPDVLLGAFQPPLPKNFSNKEDPATKERVELGRSLYFDKRLSKNHDISCNSCHALDKYGVDGEKTSPGHKGQRGDRNSPTVYNAAGHFVQFWDGRSPHVEDQATGPVLNPVEMALSDEKTVMDVLSSIPEYVEAFKRAFPEDQQPVSLKNAGRAIGSFERGLVTPSAWDKFLSGNKKALSDAEKEGFQTFVQSGCMSCHTGTLLGGTNYQKVGAVQPWPNQEDTGRYKVTENEADKMMFKVPSLRNITETAPYFHDGSAATLHEAVKMMGTHQLGRELSDDEVAKIITWLETLKGELPVDYIKEPALPKSTDKTPKANPT